MFNFFKIASLFPKWLGCFTLLPMMRKSPGCSTVLQTFGGTSLLKKKNNFLFLIGRYLLYNIVWVSAIHQHESATGIGMSFPLEPPSTLPPYPTPPCCHRALGSSSPHHAGNSHWLSASPTVTYVFQRYFLSSSHPLLPPLYPQGCSVSPLLPCK